MVWIHGGAFILGSARDYPDEGIVDNLVSKNVVVVTIQYRLGVFGSVPVGRVGRGLVSINLATTPNPNAQ
jgi:carboxylesterase type B